MTRATPRCGCGGRTGGLRMVLGMTLSAFTRVHVIISLIAVVSGLLTVSGMARGQRTAGGTGLSGPWRWIYPLGCVIALYLNVFVLVVQAFQKVAFLAALAPTQSELPF